MKIFFDTSVLISGMIEAHPMHEISFPWLKRAKAKEFEWAVCSHTLAELYATLTSMPLRPRITPAIAVKLLHENIQKEAQVLSLTGRDYLAAIKNISNLNLPGAIIYDAIIAKAAEKFRADHLLTHNEKDFSRLFPQKNSFLIFPK
ncbi:MAG: PIN domain-containing protein [Deltaproteobacteria bacterium]|nr:PIN domain-containing protein [Deltaproteobacteria bacterium]